MIEELKTELRYDPLTGNLWWARQNKHNSRNMSKPAERILNSGGKHKKDYKTINYRCKQFLSHRVIYFLMTGDIPTQSIDHINRNSLDNRWENLRLVSHSENSQNRRADKDNKAGLLGVKTYTHPKTGNLYYLSSITAKGKSHYIGCFKTPTDAHAAYMNAKAIFHPTSPVKKQDSRSPKE